MVVYAKRDSQNLSRRKEACISLNHYDSFISLRFYQHLFMKCGLNLYKSHVLLADSNSHDPHETAGKGEGRDGLQLRLSSASMPLNGNHVTVTVKEQPSDSE